MRLFISLAIAIFAVMQPVLAAAPTGQPVGPHSVGCNVNEIFTEHIHAELTIYARGRRVPIPADIGMVGTPGTMLCIYWLHTHDNSGLIHVEAPMGTFTLADFFAVWGQPLTPNRIGRFSGHVTATVNGKPYNGAPQSIPLLDGEQIVLRV
jgi:hypothetical protein